MQRFLQKRLKVRWSTDSNDPTQTADVCNTYRSKKARAIL